MKRYKQFKVICDCIHELSSFAYYAIDGASEEMIDRRMVAVGHKLIGDDDDSDADKHNK